MTRRRKPAMIAAATIALAAGGVGIAYAVDSDSDEQIGGAQADRAGEAAIDTLGGGTVTSVEREDGASSGVYEVEVRQADGSQVEVHLDDRYETIGTEPDDDTGSDDDDDGGEDD